MNFISTPTNISSNEFLEKGYSFSASLYKRVQITSKNVKTVRDLLDPSCMYDKGAEPGSIWYMENSPCKFIRTKALQEFSTILYPKGNAIIGINPNVFVNARLKTGDILMSKDSNIGECAIVTNDRTDNHMFSSGMVRLHPICDNYYLFSFLKHSFFKQQLTCAVPRGATIKHAKELWLDCYIPFPEDSFFYGKVSAFVQAIIQIEYEIKEKSEAIQLIINEELENNQKPDQYLYSYPSSQEIEESGRFDAAIFSEKFKRKIHKIENYAMGNATPKNAGFSITPGPSLEIKLLKVRIDSDTYREGYYSLILPTNISEYGTMNAIPYLGTPKKLPELKYGDVIFGEAGFQKGRSIVLLDNTSQRKYTTNAHGLYARREDGNIQESVFFRCIFDWYRSNGLIDLMAVGGSGGHFSPEYFESIKIPNFPQEIKEKIVSCYCNTGENSVEYCGDITNFVSAWKKQAQSMGIWELSQQKLTLQEELATIQQDIINGRC